MRKQLSSAGGWGNRVTTNPGSVISSAGKAVRKRFSENRFSREKRASEQALSGGSGIWAIGTYPALEPQSQRSCLGILASTEEPEAVETCTDQRGRVRWTSTYNMLLLASMSAYPDAWYTPGTVSHSPLFSTMRRPPGAALAAWPL